MEQYDIQNVWFEKEGKLFPFLIFIDDKPAGFALVGSKEFVPKGWDYYMYDYFILRPYRGNGIAEKAARQVFDKFKGKWLVYTNPTENNPIGRKFWRKTIKNYTNDNYQEYEGNTYDGEKLIFSFNNK